MAEHPLLMMLKQKRACAFYGVNYKDQAAAARRFLGRYGNPFAAVGADATGRTAIDWGVSGMPETFVLNGKGEIVYKHFGPSAPRAWRPSCSPPSPRPAPLSLARNRFGSRAPDQIGAWQP